MLIVLLLAVAAAALGLWRGGSLEALAGTRLRGTWLLFFGLLLQGGAAVWAPSWMRGSWTLFVALLGNLAILVFIARNRALPGMLLADLGIGLNLLVIVLNGAMPVSPAAARTAGIERSVEGAGSRHETMTDETVLPWLGDVVPLPYLREVWSPGDVLLALGIARLVYVRTRGGAPKQLGPSTGPVGTASDSPPEAARGRTRSPRHRQRAQNPPRAWGGLDR